MFELSVNYRSHNGIIKCAHEVVKLITKFWPHTIDTLHDERGLISGPKPVFFTGCADETFSFKKFFSDSEYVGPFWVPCLTLKLSFGKREAL